ncbi:hypothetical protein CF65_00156 [Aggregatibacter actinomycetemcomitans HK1651]|nr:hypothetical protein CF65_00156 [Aggregatibacter actinomycetemcomitans HK1651]
MWQVKLSEKFVGYLLNRICAKNIKENEWSG